MSEIKMNIWGREFALNAIFDVYAGEEIDKAQTDTLNEFISISSQALEAVEEKVNDYIISNAVSWPIGQPVDNIFKFVIPKSIYIPRNQQKKTIAILCDFKFDEEHGLAIVFDDGKLKEIGPEDIII